MMDILLASQSPRRAELLRQIGVEFDVVVSNVDEAVGACEPPQTYVRRLSVEKAKAGARTVRENFEDQPGSIQ